MELSDRTPRADQRLMERDLSKEIQDAIESLPPKQLSAVLMHKYEGMDYNEIAEVLECSIPALKSLLFRAYETLRRRLAHLAPESLQA
jgi:RNA polymerase sigma-70 factor (ECF subfamily)